MNTQQLKGALVSNGLTYQNLAEKLGISRTAFTRNINSMTQFQQSEIKEISKILKLNDLEIMQKRNDDTWRIS